MEKRYLLDPNSMAFPSDQSFGMTLRDYFAAAALQGLASNPLFYAAITQAKIKDEEHIQAQSAYQYADAMLKARSQS